MVDSPLIRKWGGAAVAAVLTLLACEVFARVLIASSSEEVVWYDEAAQLKIDQMESLGQVDVVFAGTSMAWQGFDPETFTSTDTEGRTAYNGGLNGGVPQVMSRWILEEAIPRLAPEHIVWGLSSLDLAPKYGDSNAQTYDDAFMTDPGALAGVDRWFSKYSELVAGRRLLRDPSRLFGSEADEAESKWSAARSTLGEGGQRRDFTERLDSRTESIERARLQDFAPSRTDVGSILTTIEELQRRGIDVTLVALPQPDRYVDLHPRGRTDADWANAVIERIGDETDVPVLSLQNSMPDSAFIDFTHLTEAAVVEFTAAFTELWNSGDTPHAPFGDDVLTATATLANEYDRVVDLIEARPESGQQSTSFFYNAEELGRLRQVTEFGATGDDIGTILVGTSQMRNAGDSISMTSALDETVFNLALSAASPEVWAQYLPQRILPLTGADRVVWGIGPLDLASAGGEDCAYFSGQDQMLRDALTRRDAAFSWMHDARPRQDPDPGLDFFVSTPDSTIAPAWEYYETRFGEYGDQALNPERDRARDAADFPPQSVAFEVCRPRIDLVESVVSDLVDEGVEVLVVSVPTPPFRLAVYTEETARIDDQLDQFGQRVEAAGGAFLDLTRALPAEMFADYAHVNERGAAAFTELLLDYLD